MPLYIEITDAEVAAEAPITVSLMTRLRNNALGYLGAASATKLSLPQSSAPLGWTKDFTHHDKLIRLVTGAASSGGTHAFSTLFGTGGIQATGGHTITQANLPSAITLGPNEGHFHTLGTPVVTSVSFSTLNFEAGASSLSVATSHVADPTPDTGLENIQHEHGLGGSGTAHTHPIDLRAQWVDFIIANKD